MIGWALRLVFLCCGIALLCTGIVKVRPQFLPDRVTTSEPAAPAAESGPAVNTLVYPANEQGHIILDAAVNGASVRLLVDTGASLVTLTPEDARAAGITRGELVFNHRAATANGSVRMAPVTLARGPDRSAVDLRCARRGPRTSQHLVARDEFSQPAAKL